MAFRAGYRFRVRVNSTAYVSVGVNVAASVDPLDVTNTEGSPGNSAASAATGYAAVIPGVKAMRVSVQGATFDDSDNPFISPLSVQVGNYCTLRVYLSSLSSVSWYCASFLITNVTYSAQVRGLQPVSFDGQSDALFYHPDGTG